SEPFVIKTRGRIGKTPRKAAAGQSDAEQPESADDEGPRNPIYTPLVLAGAIGGGGVLVLGLGIALICVLALRGNSTPVADVNKAAAITAVANAEAAAPAELESNPEAPIVEVNPEIGTAAPAQVDVP